MPSDDCCWSDANATTYVFTVSLSFGSFNWTMSPPAAETRAHGARKEQSKNQRAEKAHKDE